MKKHRRRRRATKQNKQSTLKQQKSLKQQKNSQHIEQSVITETQQDTASTTASTFSWLTDTLTDSATVLYKSATKVSELWYGQSTQDTQEHNSNSEENVSDESDFFAEHDGFFDIDDDDIDDSILSMIRQKQEDDFIFDASVLDELTPEEWDALEKETLAITKEIEQEQIVCEAIATQEKENDISTSQPNISAAQYATAVALFLATGGATVAATAAVMLFSGTALASTAATATLDLVSVYPNEAKNIATSIIHYLARESSENGAFRSPVFWFALLSCAAKGVDAAKAVNSNDYNARENYLQFKEATASNTSSLVLHSNSTPTHIPAISIENSANNQNALTQQQNARQATNSANLFEPVINVSTLDGSDGFRIMNEETGVTHWSVSEAGDVNADGVNDVIIGVNGVRSSNGNHAGSNYVVFGRRDGFNTMLLLSILDGTTGFRIGGELEDWLGWAINGAGDVNADGIDDVIVGAPGTSPSGVSRAGSSYVIFGRRDDFNATLLVSNLDGSAGFRIDGEAAGDNLGWSVSGAGDVNADGIDDVIVGTIGAVSRAGSSYVIFGRRDGFNATLLVSNLDGSTGFRIDGEAAGDNLGISVSGAGDVNADGIDDVIVGAHTTSPNGVFHAGSSYIIFGRATGFDSKFLLSTLNGTNGFRIDGEAADDGLGWSVSGAGDVNADGIDDVIVGTIKSSPNGVFHAGSSYIIFGRATGFDSKFLLSTLSGANGFRIDGEAVNDYLGYSVSGAGDVNADGIDDVIVGATEASPNGVFHAGSSYIIFGRATGFDSKFLLLTLNGTNGFRIDGETRDNCFGASVSGAGDVNGDGVADMVVGLRHEHLSKNKYLSSSVIFGKALSPSSSPSSSSNPSPSPSPAPNPNPSSSPSPSASPFPSSSTLPSPNALPLSPSPSLPIPDFNSIVGLSNIVAALTGVVSVIMAYISLKMACRNQEEQRQQEEIESDNLFEDGGDEENVENVDDSVHFSQRITNCGLTLWNGFSALPEQLPDRPEWLNDLPCFR